MDIMAQPAELNGIQPRKRRKSLLAQPRIHPATRLAAFSMKSLPRPETKQLELHVDATRGESILTDHVLSITRKKSLTERCVTVSEKEELTRTSTSAPEDSDKTVQTTRSLRPRKSRIPILEPTLLGNLELSSSRNPRQTTLRSRTHFTSLSPCSTPEKVSCNRLTPCSSTDYKQDLQATKRTPKSSSKRTLVRTPRSSSNQTPVKTPQSSSKQTFARCRTPRNKTPRGLKDTESSTPRTPRSGARKGTPKFFKDNISYVCEICSEEVSEKREMLKHQRLHGRRKIPDNSFTPNKAVLTRTPKSEKKNHGKFHCNVCGKNFRFRSNLKSHRLMHEQPKLFSCRSCSKSLLIVTQSDDRMIVESLAKSGTGSSDVICRDCCYGDINSNNEGRRKNDSFKCDKCSRTFGSETNLKIHLKTHVIDKLRYILKGSSSRFTAE